jgi:hypothetical protein
MHAQRNNSGIFSPYCSNSTKSCRTYRKSVLGMKYVFDNFSLHFFFKRFFTPINILQVMLRKCTETHAGLLIHSVKWSINYSCPILTKIGICQQISVKFFLYQTNISNSWVVRCGQRAEFCTHFLTDCNRKCSRSPTETHGHSLETLISPRYWEK